jgi:ABC-type bacteriocin/lantibiotic exporter with double-glycine peptidase domain
MGARQKLNSAHINGALVFAAIVGLWWQSWWLFFVVLVLMLVLAFKSGGIRLHPRR